MRAENPITIENIDLLDHDLFVTEQHHGVFETLRESGNGVHWHDEPDGPGFWSITRQAHLKEVNRLVDVFSSNRGGTQLEDRDGPEAEAMRENLMLEQDPPKHTRYRKLVNRGFTPRMIALLDGYLLNRTRMIVDDVCESGSCDFVTQIAAELPLQAIAEMVGVPLEDRSKIFDWSNRMVGSSDPEFGLTEEDAVGAAAELFMYSQALQKERRDRPADDIITTLLNADIDGDSLTETEFDMFFLLLAVAGNETTRNSMSHGMRAFSDHPDQWEKFVADPARYMDTAVDEIVRWATTVMHFRRTALSDYDLEGTTIKAGDKVIMWHASANRDPRAFDDPWTFDIERSPNDHVGFGGGGPHFCLGANLARMEIKLMFTEIAERMPDIKVTGPARMLRSNFIGGIKELPVSFTPSPSTNTAPMDRLGAAAAGDDKGYGRRD